MADLLHERGCLRAGLGRAGLQNGFDFFGRADEFLIALAHGRDFAVYAFKQYLLRIAPRNAVCIGLA